MKLASVGRAYTFDDDYERFAGIPVREEVMKLWDWHTNSHVPCRVVVLDVGRKPPVEPPDAPQEEEGPKYPIDKGYSKNYTTVCLYEVLDKVGPRTANELSLLTGLADKTIRSYMNPHKGVLFRRKGVHPSGHGFLWEAVPGGIRNVRWSD